MNLLIKPTADMIIRLDSRQKTPSKDLGKGQLTIFFNIVLQTANCKL